MIPSNHQVLYTKIRAVSVLNLLSIKVPVAIAIAKVKKSTAISRVENKKETIFLSIIQGILQILKVRQKYLKMFGLPEI
jgi:hypothetical protein